MKYILFKLGYPITILFVGAMILLACIIAIWAIPFYRMLRFAINK